METNLRTKKRKRCLSSSDPLRGTFIHCTRSGLVRSDLRSKLNQDTKIESPDSSLRNPKILIEETINNGESISHISIKDLRARRVFSPASTSFSSEKDDVGGGGAEVEDAKLQFDVDLCSEDHRNIKNTENLISRGDELFQTTPDVDPFCKSKQDTYIVLENTSSEKVSGNGSRVGEGDKHNQSNTRTRSGVLVPCSRMKLFKAPNSFSYRRLLPFLMEIEKDNANVLGIGPCRKVEKSVEERPLPSLSASPAQHPLVCLLGDSEAPPTSRSKEMTPLVVSSTICCPKSESPEQSIPETSVSPVHDPMIIKPPDSYTESASLVQQVISDKSSKMEPAHDVIGSVCVGGAKTEDTKLQFDVELCLEDQKSSGNTENSKSCGDECVQTTPPDSDIFCKSKLETDLVLGNPSSERASNNGSHVGEGEKHNQSNSKTKTRSGFLIPCSRMKLFKTPSSFSYRRLLPFLMDIEKDNSDVLRISPCRQVEKIMENRTLPLLPNSPAQHIPTDGANMEVLPMGCLFGDSAAPPIQESREMIPLTISSNIYCPNSESPEQPITESAIQKPPETSMSPDYDPMIMTPPDLYTESASQVQQDLSEKSSKLEPDHDVMGSVLETDLPVKSSCYSQVMPGALSVKEGSLKSRSHLSTKVEDRATLVPQLEMDAKPLEALNLCQDSSYIKDLIPLEKPVCGATKGILKRYPRGCRGLCNCLNCASFLLHAERAFEFSKNQMQDAEEVAMGLMKELSYLRNLLEKSVDGAECHNLVPVNQVKGACRKASELEKLAKNRLRQMNQELNIHCRTTCSKRPRVRFADHIEMLIPLTETCQAESLTNEMEDSG